MWFDHSLAYLIKAIEDIIMGIQMCFSKLVVASKRWLVGLNEVIDECASLWLSPIDLLFEILISDLALHFKDGSVGPIELLLLAPLFLCSYRCS